MSLGSHLTDPDAKMECCGGSAEAFDESKMKFAPGHYHYRGCKNDTEALKDATDCDCAATSGSHADRLAAMAEASQAFPVREIPKQYAVKMDAAADDADAVAALKQRQTAIFKRLRELNSKLNAYEGKGKDQGGKGGGKTAAEKKAAKQAANKARLASSKQAKSSSSSSSSSSTAADDIADPTDPASYTPTGPVVVFSTESVLPEGEFTIGEKTDNERRQEELSAAAGFAVSSFKRAPSQYYSWTLEQRRAFLAAPGRDHLCKTVIMTNTRYDQLSEEERKDSDRFYCIVVQYTAKCSRDKMTRAVRSLVEKPAGKKKFNFRLASSEDNDRLSGYEHNGVTPLGMKTPLKVIFPTALLELKRKQFPDGYDGHYFWLGAGEVDLKWKIGIDSFIKHFKPIIADISVPEDPMPE